MSFYVLPKDGKMTRLSIGENHAGYMDYINFVFNSFGADGIFFTSGADAGNKVFYLPRLSRASQTLIKVNIGYINDGNGKYGYSINMSAAINGTLYNYTGTGGAKDGTPGQLMLYFNSGVSDASLVLDDLRFFDTSTALTGDTPSDPVGYEPAYPTTRRVWKPDQIHLSTWGDLYPGTTEPAPYGFARERNLTWLAPILYNSISWPGSDTATDKSYQVLDNQDDEFGKYIIVNWSAGTYTATPQYQDRNFDPTQFVQMVQYWASRALSYPKIKGIIFDDSIAVDNAYMKNIYDAKTAINPDFKIYYENYLNGATDYGFVEGYPKTGYYDGYVIYPRWRPATVGHTYEMLKRTYLDTGKKPFLGLYVAGTSSLTEEYGRNGEEIGTATRQGILAENEQIAGVMFYVFYGQSLTERGRAAIGQITAYKNLPEASAPRPVSPAPRITSFSPANLSPTQDEGTTNTFSVTLDQPVTNKWLLDSVQQSETSQGFIKTWSYNDAGSHTISYTGTNANGSVLQSWTVTVNDVVKDTTQESNQKIKIYPNPYIQGKSSGNKIIFANLPTGATMKIYNSSGELVKELSVGADSKAEWDVSQAKSGIYLYVITSAEGTKKGKLSIIK